MFKTSTFDHRRKQEASNCNAAKYIFLQTIEFYDFLIGAQLLPFRYLIRVMERRKDKTLNDKEKKFDIHTHTLAMFYPTFSCKTF